MNKVMRVTFIVCSLMIAFGAVKAETGVKPLNSPVFYIYKDGGSNLNHYIPSGFMGDFGDVHIGQKYTTNGVDLKDTCVKVQYTAEKKQGAGWAGVYWQSPSNNWGDKKGGFNLSEYKALKFKARGDKGGEFIDKFLIGGIEGQKEAGDSDQTAIESVELTKDWKEYSIPLGGINLTYIIGGFGFAVNADTNPKGIVFYLDEIRLVK